MKNKRKVLVVGGAGYVGSVLINKLLDSNFDVTVLDLFIYGEEVLKNHPNLKKVKGDIRDKNLLKKIIPSHTDLIHLACISNDPSFELDPTLGKSINFDSFKPLVEISEDNGIKRFVFASSSSVYGIKNEKDVVEESKLEPLTDYSVFKAKCEEILLKRNSKNFTTTVIRPATVCGFSPRLRLDLVVNILSNLAFHKREITVLGGNQLRPNININDMCRAYVDILNHDEKKVSGKIYNVGYENFPVIEIAKMVKNVIGEDVSIVTKKTNDNRSYHISSKKIHDELGFVPKFTIEDAIRDLRDCFDKNVLTNPLTNEFYFNIKRMNSIKLI
ncbi:SDR family oxidoreductase [Candidatus Pelagibacter ubique]|nr:SDR family oxidoreductase [Candidatus Pelagibacter ubique]